MPPKSFKSPTASKPPIELNLAAVEDDISGLTLNDGEVHDIDEKSAPIGPGAKARRRRNREKSRRLERSKDAEADDAASKTPKERDSISEAGNAEPNDVSDTDTIATEPLPQFRLDHPPRHVMPISLSCLQADTSCSSIQAPLVGVPILAHYELRELPDTGDNEDDHDEGLFATQKIYQGTRIISERPILTLPAPGDQLQELVPAYYNLPKVEQERIWNLRPAAPEASEQLQNLRFLTDRLAFDLQNIIFKSDGARTKVEEATLEEMAPKLENAMNVWRVAARWHANRCSMTDLPAEQREYLPKGTPITGLFIERAHIRHSCLPNCFASYDANLGRMNVHVTRDIAAGEELTLSAFADTTYYKNAADRKEELSAWGLTCNCEACDEKHPKFQTHEAARQRAHTRAILLADTLTRLDVDEQFSEDDLNTAQDITLALIRDLKASACENVETVRWRNILVDRILPVRSLVGADNERLLAMHLTVRHAKEAERLGRICYGEDREEFKILKQTKEGCEATVKMAEEEIATALARTEMSDEE